jgi:hypothetical protein
LERPYINPPPGSRQAVMTKEMLKLRQCIKWTFKEFAKFSAYVDWVPETKILHKTIGNYYAVACFLHNIHSTFCGNQTATYYDTSIMSAEDYLALVG